MVNQVWVLMLVLIIEFVNLLRGVVKSTAAYIFVMSKAPLLLTVASKWQERSASVVLSKLIMLSLLVACQYSYWIVTLK